MTADPKRWSVRYGVHETRERPRSDSARGQSMRVQHRLDRRMQLLGAAIDLVGDPVHLPPCQLSVGPVQHGTGMKGHGFRRVLRELCRRGIRAGGGVTDEEPEQLGWEVRFDGSQRFESVPAFSTRTVPVDLITWTSYEIGSER